MSTSQIGLGASTALSTALAFAAPTETNTDLGNAPNTLAYTGFELVHSLAIGISFLFLGLLIILLTRTVEPIPERKSNPNRTINNHRSRTHP